MILMSSLRTLCLALNIEDFLLYCFPKRCIILHLNLWSGYVFLNNRFLLSYSIVLDPRPFINHFNKDQEIGDELSQSSDLVISSKEDSYNEEHIFKP